MYNIDSLSIINTNQRIDSLNNLYNYKFDSLLKINEQTKIGQTYFSDIISYQWTLLSIQTAMFIGIIVIIFSIIGLLSWKFYFKKIQDRLSSIEKTTTELEESKKNISILEAKVEKTNMNTLRSLYEGATNLIWKAIWHIRYCESFYDRGLFDGLQTHLKILEKEFEEIKNKKQLKSLKEFENISGVKNILRKMIQNEKVSLIPVNILSDIESNTDN